MSITKVRMRTTPNQIAIALVPAPKISIEFSAGKEILQTEENYS